MSELIFQGFLETLIMVLASGLIGCVFGIPSGILLFITGSGGIAECRNANLALGFLINCLRSIPYIILTVLLIPFTRFVVGSSIGTASAVVPLALSATLLVARVVEESLRIVPAGLIEVGHSIGASKFQIITKILMPEALPNMISGMTLVLISLTGFSAMAGAVGGGGLGDLAIRYGYQRYNFEVLAYVVLILVAMVQTTQAVGDKIAACLRK